MKKASPLRSEILALAAAVVKKYPHDAGVASQVQALINSLDDTLSDRDVLEELKALKADGMPFPEVFASQTREC